MTPSSPTDGAARFDALTVPLAPGVTLVEASAGTGKTFAITRLVLRLLLEGTVENLSQILVVTFTVKATQELVTRIRATLRAAEQVWSETPPARDTRNNDLFVLREQYGEAGRTVIARALGSLDDLAVSTIHGFCQRILAESALESRIPFRTTFIQDETEPFVRAARDWARVHLMRDAEQAQRVVGGKSAVEEWIRPLVIPFRRQAGTRVDHDPTDPAQSLLAHFITTVDSAFTEEKERRHLLGFDDLLRKLSDVLTAEGEHGPLAQRIRSRFKAALIDEFQDTDRTQFPIFSLAFAGCPLFLIGDPKQSIFRFRGADIHAYLRAAALAEHRYTLLENYRSTPQYVAAVEQLFTKEPNPFRVPEQEIGFPRVTAALTPTPPGGLGTDGRSAMEWWWLPGSLGRAGGTVSKDDARALIMRDIVNEVVRLSNEGLPFRSVAVLVRANMEAREMKRAFDAARVPAVISGDADVLNSEEADELLRLVSAIAAPTNGRMVRAAMASRLWGSDASEVARTLDADGEDAWLATSELFRAARDTWRTRGVSVALGDLMATRESARRLLALPDGERRLTNVRHLLELWHEAWAEHGIAPESMAAWVARERTVPNTPDRRELRLETDSEAVQILTIHKAKGLQFDVVFCPTLWSTNSPRPGPLGVSPALGSEHDTPVLDLGSAQHADRVLDEEYEDAAESMRLTYVALTRAVHRCYIAFGEIGRRNSASGSSLGYLLRAGEGVDRDCQGDAAVLEALIARSRGVMAWREVQDHASRRVVVSGVDEIAEPRARTLSLERGQLESWRATSFTNLTGDAGSHGVATEEGRDVADPVLVPMTYSAARAETGFRAFPAGIKAGIALHEMFEQLDFRRVDEPQTELLVSRTLEAHGLAGSDDVAEQRVVDVTQMLRTVCASPIPHADFVLGDVTMRETMREWRFDLSLSTASTRRIADVLEVHGSAQAKAYAPVLRTLRESSLGGYLNGVVDVALERDGRWWIVDWKSNRLGDDDRDYAPEQLSAAMMNGHYTLQYHLYALALHRHLAVRQPDYDPAMHWGGIAYVFLRGVTGTGEGGWFTDVITPELLYALDAALGRRT